MLEVSRFITLLLTQTIEVNVNVSKAKSGDLIYKDRDDLTMMVPEEAFERDAYIFNQSLSNFDFID